MTSEGISEGVSEGVNNMKKSWKCPDGMNPETWKDYRIFKSENKYNTRQHYKKAFKKANTRKVYKDSMKRIGV